MKKIYVKYKILVNGFCPLNEFKLDGFTLLTSNFDEEIFHKECDPNKEGIDLNLNYYLYSCVTSYETKSYRYFASDDFFELNVSNKVVVNVKNARKYLEKENEVLNRVKDFEMKLRLIFNVPLLFQVIAIEFYDENKEYCCTMLGNKQMSLWNRLDYPISQEEISNNSRFGFDLNAMKNVDNECFKRALEFYDDSFESDKISIRFILIFSCLESIFNLDSEEITSKLSRYTAKLLSEGNKESYDEISTNITNLYKKRSKYVHGANNDIITTDDELLLRRYARKILIIYWQIIFYREKTSKQILEFLDGNEDFDLMTKMMIAATNSNDFSDQQHRIIEVIEKTGISIPEYVKNNLLSKCNDKDERK